jgi:DNA (cytosine-5)-methyltransferase 1
MHWPESIATDTSIETILDDGSDAKSLPPHVLKCLNVWNDFLRRAPQGEELPSFPLWSMEWGATYPYEDQTPYALWRRYGLAGLTGMRGSHGRQLGYLRSKEARWSALPSHARVEEYKFPKWKVDFIRQNREFYRRNRSWIDPWLPSILEFASSYQKFEWNVKGGEKNLWQYVIQNRASGVRVKRRTTAPSLIAMTDTQVPIIGWQKRYMTPRECARLQSLDSLKQLPDTNAKSFEALGNAVNADVVERIAAALLNSQFSRRQKSSGAKKSSVTE